MSVVSWRWVAKKILIIDDDQASNELAARFLKSLGLDVVTTESAFNSSALVTAEQPDLVLVDVRMPGLTGDTLIRMAKGRDGGTPCPFVLYSTTEPAALSNLAQECGADGHIHKSGRLQELAKSVRQYLGDD